MRHEENVQINRLSLYLKEALTLLRRASYEAIPLCCCQAETGITNEENPVHLCQAVSSVDGHNFSCSNLPSTNGTDFLHMYRAHQRKPIPGGHHSCWLKILIPSNLENSQQYYYAYICMYNVLSRRFLVYFTYYIHLKVAVLVINMLCCSSLSCLQYRQAWGTIDRNCWA